MEIRKALAPAAITLIPGRIRERFYGEQWQKNHIDIALRDHEDALALKTHPLPYLELHFKVTNRLPVDLQVYGASVEIWLGKPVVQFYSYLSDSLQPGESRKGLRAYTFLNSFQSDLLNPPKKDQLPPNVTVILTVSCRSRIGLVEKTVKSTWWPPRVIP
jgi:hypothetical protein